MSRPAPGEVGQPIEVAEDELTFLLREALARGDASVSFVWRGLDSELAVDVGRVRAVIDVELPEELIQFGLALGLLRLETPGDLGSVTFDASFFADPAATLAGLAHDAERRQAALSLAAKLFGEAARTLDLPELPEGRRVPRPPHVGDLTDMTNPLPAHRHRPDRTVPCPSPQEYFAFPHRRLPWSKCVSRPSPHATSSTRQAGREYL